jgi:hypothetical protein
METALKRDRGIVIAALSLIIGASWIYVLNGAGMSMSASEMSSWSMALGQVGPGQMNIPGSEDMSAMSRTESSASDDMSGSPSGAMADAMAAMATPAVWTAGCQFASNRDPLFASNRDPSGCAGMGLSA